MNSNFPSEDRLRATGNALLINISVLRHLFMFLKQQNACCKEGALSLLFNFFSLPENSKNVFSQFYC
jgi:hypothetical protein